MWLANGLRYPLVGGTRQRHFDGTNFEPRKMLQNAATPTSRVHAVLGGSTERKTLCLKSCTPIILRLLSLKNHDIEIFDEKALEFIK